jgi:hypothetical protein
MMYIYKYICTYVYIHKPYSYIYVYICEYIYMYIHKFILGMRNDNIYSTNAEDYLDVDLKELAQDIENKKKGFLEENNDFREI